MSEYTDIVVETEDPVCLIRLNRPEKLNAVTYHTLAEIRQAIDTAAADPAVVGIVVTGTGRGFCAGLDSSALQEVTADGGQSRRASANTDDLPGIFSYFLEVPKPIIAAVNGVAAGGGLMLATLSDVRFASRESSYVTAFLQRGLIAEHGSSWILSRLVGTGKALDLLFRSPRIYAEEAYRIGLVEFLSEPESVVDDACAYVREIAASAAPKTLAESKRLVYRHAGMGYDESLREADRHQWEAVARPDATEGARALLEKRKPVFERLGRE